MWSARKAAKLNGLYICRDSAFDVRICKRLAVADLRSKIFGRYPMLLFSVLILKAAKAVAERPR